MTLKRVQAKKSNVYKIIIFDRHHQHTAYFSSIIKCERYIEEWAQSTFKKEGYEIIMSRLNIQDDNQTWGTLIDSGAINLLNEDISFDIKIYKLKIL